MNIYEKIQKIKLELLEANLKKTGENKYSGFKYYELADFVPTIVKLCDKYKVFTKPDFTKENAKLVITNIEKPDEFVEYVSPLEELELKGCNKIQALGGTQTYLRRYLYMNAFDIVENDMFDKVSGKDEVKDNIENEKILEKKFNNGKYAGKTFLEVCSDNMAYIDWLIGKGNKTAEKAKEEYFKTQPVITDEEFEQINK